MAQKDDQDVVYQSQVAKSWEKLGIAQNIDLKVRHHPQNPKNFWNFFLNFLGPITINFELITLNFQQNVQKDKNGSSALTNVIRVESSG